MKKHPSRKLRPLSQDPEFLRFTQTVIPFSERLHVMSQSIRDRCNEVFVEFKELDDIELSHMANQYRKLSHFTKLLAHSVDNSMAEVSDTSAALGRKPPLNPMLREYFTQDMDRALLYEIKEIVGNYNDGDCANFLKQVELYCGTLRTAYHIESRGNEGPPTTSWQR